jgi:hypothetical protein
VHDTALSEQTNPLEKAEIFSLALTVRKFEAIPMMLRLSLEYGVLVFLAAIGVIQLAVMSSRLHKLVFFKRKVNGYLFSLVMIIPACYIFFTWNYHYATGIVQGAEQAGLFILSITLALVFTLTVSSLINRSRPGSPAPEKEGLEVLREITYFQALYRRFGRRD